MVIRFGIASIFFCERADVDVISVSSTNRRSHNRKGTPEGFNMNKPKTRTINQNPGGVQQSGDLWNLYEELKRK
jgi:hypothetical protein